MLLTIKNSTCLLFVCSFLFTTLSSYADDGLSPGPGIFSGQSGEYSLLKLFPPNSNKDNIDLHQNEENLTEVQISEVLPTSDQANAVDFKTYQEWSRLRDANPELYNDFKLYLEYKEFLKSQK